MEQAEYKFQIKKDPKTKKIIGEKRMPYFLNHQIRGSFKDSCGLLSKAEYGLSAKLTAYKKVIDGGIMVFPRRIAIEIPEEYYNEDGDFCLKTENLDRNQRPIFIKGKYMEPAYLIVFGKTINYLFLVARIYFIIHK